MENETQTGGSSAQGHEGAESMETEVSLEQRLEKMQADLDQALKSKNRILEEHGRTKQHLKRIQAEREEQEQKVLKEKGQFEDLYYKEKTTNEEWKSKYEGIQKEALRKDFGLQLRKYAPDLREDMDLVEVALRDFEGLQADPETLTFNGMDKAIPFLREKKPHWFEQNANAPQFQKRPSGHTQTGTTETGFDAELKAAKTQAQLDAVYSKYGKDGGRPLF